MRTAPETACPFCGAPGTPSGKGWQILAKTVGGQIIACDIADDVDPLALWAMAVGFTVLGDYAKWAEREPIALRLAFGGEVRRKWERMPTR